MAAKGAAGGTAHGVPLGTLKECLEFLEWLHKNQHVQRNVAGELATRIGLYYNNPTYKVLLPSSLKNFLGHVSSVYKQISKNTTPRENDGKSAEQITQAFSECLSKVHSALSLLLFHVDYAYGNVGGGTWRDFATRSGENGLSGYLTSKADIFNGIIPGGFSEGELNTLQGIKLAHNLNEALKRNISTPDVFTGVLFNNLVKDTWLNVDTGNVMLLLWAFCDYVETHEAGGELKTNLETELKKKGMCFDWKKLVAHCTKLEGELSKLFGSTYEDFSFKPFTTTGRAFAPDALRPEAFAGAFEKWFENHWDDIGRALEEIKMGVDTLDEPSEFAPEYLYPYGIVLNKDKQHEWQEGLTSLPGVLNALVDSGEGGLTTLKTILKGETCPKLEQQPPPSSPKPAKPAAPKTKATKPVINQAGTPPNQNTSRSGAKTATSSVTTSSPSPGGAGAPGQAGTKSDKGKQEPASTTSITSSTPKNNVKQQQLSPPQPAPTSPAPAPGTPAGPVSTSQPGDGGAGQKSAAPQTPAQSQPSSGTSPGTASSGAPSTGGGKVSSPGGGQPGGNVQSPNGGTIPAKKSVATQDPGSSQTSSASGDTSSSPGVSVTGGGKGLPAAGPSSGTRQGTQNGSTTSQTPVATPPTTSAQSPSSTSPGPSSSVVAAPGAGNGGVPGSSNGTGPTSGTTQQNDQSTSQSSTVTINTISGGSGAGPGGGSSTGTVGKDQGTGNSHGQLQNDKKPLPACNNNEQPVNNRGEYICFRKTRTQNPTNKYDHIWEDVNKKSRDQEIQQHYQTNLHKQNSRTQFPFIRQTQPIYPPSRPPVQPTIGRTSNTRPPHVEPDPPWGSINLIGGAMPDVSLSGGIIPDILGAFNGDEKRFKAQNTVTKMDDEKRRKDHEAQIREIEQQLQKHKEEEEERLKIMNAARNTDWFGSAVDPFAGPFDSSDPQSRFVLTGDPISDIDYEKRQMGTELLYETEQKKQSEVKETEQKTLQHIEEEEKLRYERDIQNYINRTIAEKHNQKKLFGGAEVDIYIPRNSKSDAYDHLPTSHMNLQISTRKFPPPQDLSEPVDPDDDPNVNDIDDVIPTETAHKTVDFTFDNPFSVPAPKVTGIPRVPPNPNDFKTRKLNVPLFSDPTQCHNPWSVSPSSTDTTPSPFSPPPDHDHLPPPKTAREMLYWFVGLNTLRYIEFITEHVNTLFKDFKSDAIEVTGGPITLTASMVTTKLTEACLYSATVIYKIRHNNDFKAFSTFDFKSEYSKFHYSSDPACLLCQLRDYVYACHYQLEFLKAQCERDKLSGGWQDYKYGSDIKTPSPLQAFLTDGWDSKFKTHLFDPCNLCHKSRIRMGFGKEDLPEIQQTGATLSSILTPSCGGSDPLRTLASYLNCLTRRTPRTTGELVSYFHHFGMELHNYASKSLSPLGTAITKSHLDCPYWDHLVLHDLDTVRGIRGTELLNYTFNSSHDNEHPRTLSTLVGCSSDNTNCHPRMSPITYRAYALYSQSFAHTYLSWAVYLPDRLNESLEKLHYELKKHVSIKCSSLYLCSTALPLLYTHGITPPEVGPQQTLTCSDVISKLKDVITGKPIAALMTAMDNFLYGIREPFIFTLVALWSLAFLIFANTMLYRLDVLYIRSHLIRTMASHLIDVKALLIPSRKMLSLYDANYFDDDPNELLNLG